MAHAQRILEQALREIETRDRRLRMPLADELGVAAEDRRLHAARADHVIRHEQELAVLRPGVVPSDDVGQLGQRTRRDVVVEQQVEHGHEVALAGTETAMQIRGLAGAALDRLLDEGQRVVETGVELRRHDVVAQRRFGMRHAIGELEDEVALVDLLRDRNQFSDQGHCRAFLQLGWSRIRRRKSPPGSTAGDFVGGVIVEFRSGNRRQGRAGYSATSPATDGLGVLQRQSGYYCQPATWSVLAPRLGAVGTLLALPVSGIVDMGEHVGLRDRFQRLTHGRLALGALGAAHIVDHVIHTFLASYLRLDEGAERRVGQQPGVIDQGHVANIRQRDAAAHSRVQAVA
jgi:hypothetical protein